MTAYRDATSSELSTFAKHISIAETLLGVNADLRAQLSIDDFELHRSYRQTWGDLWEQLDQARSIVVRLSRDVSAFDAARVRAGNPYHVAAGMTPIRDEMREATRDAMGALRDSVPEIVVPSQKPSPVEPRPSESHWKPSASVRAKIGLGIVTVVVAIVHYLS